jgi:hypothetical protein
LKMMVSYSKPYLNDEKLFGVLIQRLIWKWWFLILSLIWTMWKYVSSLFKALFENDVFLFENIILPYLADCLFFMRKVKK